MKGKINFVISLLFGLMMFNSGLNKFLNYMPTPELSEAAGKLMMAFGESGWLFPLIAIVEIIGGVLCILPRTRALGAIVLLPVMVGILLFNIVSNPSGIIIAAALFVANLWIILVNKERYLPIVQMA